MVRIVQRLLNIRSQTTVVSLSFLIVWLVFSSAAQSPATSGVDSIRAEELRQKLSYIASERFKGRGNGTPELNMAAEYIAGIFEKNGLKPAGDAGSYYQRFNVYSSRIGPNNELRIHGGASLDLKARSDFIPELWSVSGTVTGPLELVEDSRSGALSLNGKIAVELEDRIVSDDPEFPTNATEGRKLEAAGAIGAIIIQNLPDSNRSRLSNLAEGFRDDLPVRLTAMASVDVPDYPQIPVVVLPSDIGRQLLAELRKPQAKVSAVLTVDVERKVRGTQNVLGLLEGSDHRL